MNGILQINIKEQLFRLRNKNQPYNNEKNWTDTGVFCSGLEFFTLSLELSKIKNWNTVMLMNALNKIKLKHSHYHLHLSGLDLVGDASVFGFRKHSQMIDFIDDRCMDSNGCVVWLVSKNGSTDVFISENHLSIQDFMCKKQNWQSPGEYFLQEYDSFQEAYQVAVDIAETSPLCYPAQND